MPLFPRHGACKACKAGRYWTSVRRVDSAKLYACGGATNKGEAERMDMKIFDMKCVGERAPARLGAKPHCGPFLTHLADIVRDQA